MSAITKMLEKLNEKMPEKNLSAQSKAILDWIKNYDAERTAEYNKGRSENKIMFGKYTGNTVEQVVQMEKGKDYLGWLYRQTWFNEEKFTDLYEKVKSVVDA